MITAGVIRLLQRGVRGSVEDAELDNGAAMLMVSGRLARSWQVVEWVFREGGSGWRALVTQGVPPSGLLSR
jgi:hypothetical protein